MDGPMNGLDCKLAGITLGGHLHGVLQRTPTNLTMSLEGYDYEVKLMHQLMNTVILNDTTVTNVGAMTSTRRWRWWT